MPRRAVSEGAGGGGGAVKERVGLGVDVRKGEDFSQWYTQTVTRAEVRNSLRLMKDSSHSHWA